MGQGDSVFISDSLHRWTDCYMQMQFSSPLRGTIVIVIHTKSVQFVTLD